MFGEAWSMNLTEMTEKNPPKPQRVVKVGDRCDYCYEDDLTRLNCRGERTVICNSCAREKYREDE